MDLDKPVTVNYQGKKIFKGKLKRSEHIIQQTAAKRLDANLIFSAMVTIRNQKTVAPDN